MNELEIAQARIEALKAAIDKLCDGNRTAFGRRLGYKDGAFVRQMISGERPISEKTIRTIEALPGMRNWFNSPLVLVDEAHATSPSGKHKHNVVDALNIGAKAGLIPGLTATPSLTMDKNLKPGPKHRGTYPLISWSQARTWETTVTNFAHGDAEDWFDSPVESSPNSFYLTVIGESMFDINDHRSFREGEIILVDPLGPAVHQSFVVVQLTNETELVLRQLIIESGRSYLKALNPAWPNRIIEVEGTEKYCGVVRTKIVNY